LRLGFFVCAAGTIWMLGPVGPLAVVGPCVLYLLLSSDSTGGKFFLQPPGLAIAGVCLAGWAAAGAGWLEPLVSPQVVPLLEVPAGMGELRDNLGPAMLQLGWATLPFTPLIAATALIGWREGYHISLFWRLVGCWVVVPLGLALLLPAHGNALLESILPPLAIIGGAGLQGCLVRLRRWRLARRTNATVFGAAA